MFLVSISLHILYTPALVLSAYHLVHVSPCENECLQLMSTKWLPEVPELSFLETENSKFSPDPTGDGGGALIHFANLNICFTSLGTFQIFFHLPLSCLGMVYNQWMVVFACCCGNSTIFTGKIKIRCKWPRLEGGIQIQFLVL